MTLAGMYTLAASLIWSVNTLFLLDAGLGIGEVFIANALFSAGMVLFEIPTGVIADTLGRRVSYLLSVAILGATTVGYVLAAQAGAGLAVFGAVSVVMGLGFTFYSGALEAWLVDGLKAVGDDWSLDHVFARGHQVSGVAMLVGTVTGGFLGPLLFGIVLGMNWDGGTVDSWGYAFVSLGAVVALGPIFLLIFGPRPKPGAI